MPGLYKAYISDFETSQSGSIFSWADQWNVIEIENQQTFKSYSLKILPYRYHYWETNVLYYQYRHRQKYCITIVITFWVTFVTGTATNKYSCKIDIVVWLFYFKLNNNCWFIFSQKFAPKVFVIWLDCFLLHSTVIRSMGILSPK